MRRVAIGSLAAAGVLALAGCGGDDGGDDLTAFCDQARAVEESGQALGNLQGGNIDAAKEAFEQTADDVQAAADAAPEEIQSDMQTVADFVDDLNSQLADAQSPEDLIALAGELQSEAAQEFQEAGENVRDYLAENCEENA